MRPAFDIFDGPNTTLEKSLSPSSIKDISASKEARQLFKKTNLLSSKNLENECNLVTVA